MSYGNILIHFPFPMVFEKIKGLAFCKQKPLAPMINPRRFFNKNISNVKN